MTDQSSPNASLVATWRDLSPLQRIAVLGIAVLLVMWAAFDRLAPEFITLFGGVLAVEEGRKAVQGK